MPQITYSLLNTTKTAGWLSLGKGLIGRTLLGAGEKAIPAAERIIGRSGHILESALGKGPTFRQALKNKELGTWAKNTFIGRSPVKVLKQRMQQGGIFGRGGLLHSTVSMPDELAAGIKRHGIAKGLWAHKGQALGWGLGAGFTVAAPAYGVYNDIRSGNYSHIPKSLLSGASWAIAEPFSFIGQMPVQSLAEKGLDVAYNTGVQKLKNSFKPTIPRLGTPRPAMRGPSVPKVPKISPYYYA